MQENDLHSSPESDSDSKDSSDEDIDVHQEETMRRSHSRNSNSSGDDEVDGELEGRNKSGNFGGMRNSEDTATVVDREAISINSVSLHKNYGKAFTYKGLQGDKDFEALHGQQGSTEALAGPDIVDSEAPSPITIESEVASEAGRSKRKRILRKEVLDTLNGCLCGEVVNPLILPSDAIIKCKEMGCETEWVSNFFWPSTLKLTLDSII